MYRLSSSRSDCDDWVSDISSLNDWIGNDHYEADGIVSPVPGVTSFMTANGNEEVSTSINLTTAQDLAVYFGGVGTNNGVVDPLGSARYY